MILLRHHNSSLSRSLLRGTQREQVYEEQRIEQFSLKLQASSDFSKFRSLAHGIHDRLITHCQLSLNSLALLHMRLNDSGGQGGIRTHGDLSATHAFQACSFDHSDTCPVVLQHSSEQRGRKLLSKISTGNGNLRKYSSN